MYLKYPNNFGLFSIKKFQVLVFLYKQGGVKDEKEK